MVGVEEKGGRVEVNLKLELLHGWFERGDITCRVVFIVLADFDFWWGGGGRVCVVGEGGGVYSVCAWP